MNNNLIQWPRAKYWDKALNPIVGCEPCSPACENCYAAAQMRRFGAAECSSLNYWRKLRDINILTADGRKRLARAEKANAAALEGTAK